MKRITMIMNVFLPALILMSITGPGNVLGQKKIERSDDIIQLILPTLAVGHSLVNINDSQFRFANAVLFSTFTVTEIGKYLIPDMRPDGTNDLSYISGHTSISFAGASLLNRQFGWKVGFPAYLAASYVGWSRIKSNKHKLDDVVRGAAIGVFCTYAGKIKFLQKFRFSPGDTHSGSLGINYSF